MSVTVRHRNRALLALMACMKRLWFLGMAVVLASAASIALGEAGEPEKRGSIPIGQSADGSGPSDGALIGGSVKRGGDTGALPQRDVNRCKELTATLKDDCINDLTSGVSGALPTFEPFPKPLPASDIYADPRRRRSYSR